MRIGSMLPAKRGSALLLRISSRNRPSAMLPSGEGGRASDHDAVEPVVARDAVGRHSGCSRIGRGHGVPFLCFGKQEQPAERGGEQQSGQRIRHNGQKKRDAARAVPSSLLAGFRVYFPSMRSM